MSVTYISEYADCQKRLAAADKAYTYIRDAVSKRFGNQITRYQNYLDSTNVAITKNGTRSTRLELIEARLEEQQQPALPSTETTDIPPINLQS